MPERTRTSDLQVRNLTLYPLSYGHVRWAMAEREGFEPSEEETPFNGLANRRTRPLCDLSEAADDSMGSRAGRSQPPSGSGAETMQKCPCLSSAYPSSALPPNRACRRLFYWLD